MKHTPGPWGFELTRTFDDLNRECFRVYGLDDVNIAKVSGDITKEESNARLIAAAPELLEVCKETLTRLEWWAKDPITRSLDAAFADLTRIIDKAEGRE